jgi:hypothetical protein
MGRGGMGLLGGLAVELSGKGAIGRDAGQGRKMAPRGSFRSPQRLTSEHRLDTSLSLWLKEHIGLRQ